MSTDGSNSAVSNTANEENVSSVLKKGTQSVPSIQGQQIKHSDFASIQYRLVSFRPWRHEKLADRQEFARAGFFYTRLDDLVVCFVCGGGLKKWKEGAHPLQEHKRHFPTCSFVLTENITIESEEAMSEPEENLHNLGISCLSATTPDVSEEAATAAGSSRQDERLCRVCFENELNVVLLPCGHMVVCSNCAPRFATCPVCRQRVIAKIKAILPD